MKKNTLVIDIDQTITQGMIADHLRQYNKSLNLDLNEEHFIKADRKYSKVFHIPEIIRFRTHSDNNEILFQQTRHEIRSSEELHLNMQGIKDASRGISHLIEAGFSFKGYYTVRLPEVIAATKQWLKKNNFPNPLLVVQCDSVEDKLIKIIRDFYNSSRRVFLIDDSLSGIYEAYESMINKHPFLQNIVPIAFGKQDNFLIEEEKFFKNCGVKIYHLASWSTNDVKNLIKSIVIN